MVTQVLFYVCSLQTLKLGSLVINSSDGGICTFVLFTYYRSAKETCIFLSVPETQVASDRLRLGKCWEVVTTVVIADMLLHVDADFCLRYKHFFDLFEKVRTFIFDLFDLWPSLGEI